MTRYIHNSETEFSSRPSVAAGEREPGPQTVPTSPVRRDAISLAGSGSRLRYVAERGGGSSGTAYNRLDWEVLDQDAPAGRRVMCRATFKNAQAIVKSGRTKARLGVLDPQDLPVFAQALPEPQITIKAAELDRVLAFVLPAIGSDADRAALWGVSLAYERDGITIAACDGHMGAVCRLRPETLSEFPAATLPRPLIPKLRALLKGHDDSAVEIAIGPRAARITSDNWSIAAKLIDAAFPSPAQWMAKPVADPVVVDRAELGAVMSRIEAATDLDNTKLKQRGVLLSFADQGLHLTTKNHVIEDDLPAFYNGSNPSEIGVNTVHVQAILAAIDAAEIELHVKDRDSVMRVCAHGEAEDAFTTTPYRV